MSKQAYYKLIQIINIKSENERAYNLIILFRTEKKHTFKI